MREFAAIFLPLFTGFVLASSALAESATKDECVRKFKEAALLSRVSLDF